MANFLEVLQTRLFPLNDSPDCFSVIANSIKPLNTFLAPIPNKRTIFSISQNKVYHREQPGTHEEVCCGSSLGWLIMMNPRTSTVYLLNQYTKAVINLPPITSLLEIKNQFSTSNTLEGLLHGCKASVSNLLLPAIRPKNGFIHKAVYAPDQCTVIIIYGEFIKLAMYIIGDETWTEFKDSNSYYDDIFYHEGDFYAVDEYGGVVICKTGHWPSPKVTEYTSRWLFYGNKIYLVGTTLGLLLIVRYIWDDPDTCYRTNNFKVYKLISQVHCIWKEIKSLADCVLFLGQNHSVALSLRVVPQCRKNCIYFTDDHFEGRGHDRGIFNVEDGSISKLPEGGFNHAI